MRHVSTLLLLTLSLALGWLSPPRSAHAFTITFEAIDLPDTTSGEDQWQYLYTVSDFPFPAFVGFDLFFDLAEGYLFGDLEDAPVAPNTDWDVLTLQPDPNLPAAGVYDALALVNGASVVDPFIVNFLWRGSGNPGAQRFEVFDDTFTVTAFGTTTAAGATTPVPEPGTLVLIGTGLAGLVGWRRRVSKAQG